MSKSEEANDSNDWISSLVKQEQLKDHGARNKATTTKTKDSNRTTKRKQKQLAARHEENLTTSTMKESQSKYRKTNGDNSNNSCGESIILESQKVKYRPDDSIRTKRRLQCLSKIIQDRIIDLKLKNSRWKKPYTGQQKSINSIVDKKRKREKTTLDDNIIQPKISDYGGIGLARRSLFISLDNPSIIGLINEEFIEHIPGFYGKQRTKAMKKQLNSKLIWKQMNYKNPNKMKLLNTIVNGKKLSDMNPDERVLAMIKVGIV